MKSKELLIPRFEVIEEYPYSKYKKGDVLELKQITSDKIFHNTEDFFVGNFFTQPELEKYPHLFRKLNWWEHRKAEDMPKKVMSLADDKKDTYDIEEWDMQILVGWIDKKSRSCCSLKAFNPEYGYFPVD